MELGSVLVMSILILALAGHLTAYFFKQGNGAKEMQYGASKIGQFAKQVLRPRGAAAILATVAAVTIISSIAMAQPVPREAQGSGPSRQAGSHEPGGEANLRLPDLSKVDFLGIDGHTL